MGAIIVSESVPGPFGSLISCPDTLWCVVNLNGALLKLAEKNTPNYHECALVALRNTSGTFSILSESLKSDPECITAAIEAGDTLSGSHFQFAPTSLRSNRELVMKELRLYGYSLQYVSEELKSDLGLVLTAETTSRGSSQYASESLWDDPVAVRKLVQIDRRLIWYASKRCWSHPSVKVLVKGWRRRRNSA